MIEPAGDLCREGLRRLRQTAEGESELIPLPLSDPPPVLPWGGQPPGAPGDPVGIPESLISPVPGGAADRGTLLARLADDIAPCLKCALGHSRNRFVFGVGDPDASLMLIGEAPGAEEDARGEPFVGRAGQLLDKILESIGFTRRQVFIANILKCRPPGNRDPLAEEAWACEPYLQRQVALVQPAVICALGRIAAQTLLRTNTSLTALRGQVHHYLGRPLLVTYHPAALLRNPEWKRPAWEDVKLLRSLHDEQVGR